MLPIVRRLLETMTGRRSLEAGAAGRRWASAGRITSLNNELQARNTLIRARAAQFARNNAHVAAGVNALVSNIVGPGIVPRSQHPDSGQRQRLQDLWSAWTDTSDAEDGADFYGQQALAVRQMIEAGESFTRFLLDTSAYTLNVPLKLQVIHPSQVPTAALNWSPKTQIRAGVEFSDDGLRRVAYWMLPARPEDFFQPLGSTWTPFRVPAEDVCHLFERLEPGQVRGLSWLAPILLMVNELDQLQDAALVRAKLANLICAAMTIPDDQPSDLEAGGTQDGTAVDVTMEPGTILPLRQGATMEFFDPKESTTYDAFVKTHLRAVAAGMGIPYEALTGDLTSVNYSSIRAGLVEFRKRLEHWQHNTVVFRLCRPTWDRFIKIGVASGKIPASAYARNPAAFHAVEWLPPRQEWVDPVKDLEAETGAIGSGLMSRTQALARRGVDIDRVRKEIQMERAADKAAGLDFQAVPAAKPVPAANTEPAANA